MVSITHLPPPLRCEIPIGDVSIYYMTKLSAPQALDPGVSPPFQLWPQSSLCDVMDPKITLEEVKRTLQAIQMNSAPGQDRINYKTWKFIDLNQEVIMEIFKILHDQWENLLSIETLIHHFDPQGG